MNTHINRDLPVALNATCREPGLDLRTASPEHADFERVDTLLARVEDPDQELVSDRLARVARPARPPPAPDRRRGGDVGRRSRARRSMDERPGALGARRQAAAGDYLLALDRMVGLAGRGLLIPADSWLLKPARPPAR